MHRFCRLLFPLLCQFGYDVFSSVIFFICVLIFLAFVVVIFLPVRNLLDVYEDKVKMGSSV
jgi:hypothetical protein